MEDPIGDFTPISKITYYKRNPQKVTKVMTIGGDFNLILIVVGVINPIDCELGLKHTWVVRPSRRCPTK
jgi:hypothetical protein